ncbi:MAG: hypothetical protein MHM6MM_000361 [Cercozoa sp. M6MM]
MVTVLELNDRVRHCKGGYKGTVRYLGPLPSSEEQSGASGAKKQRLHAGVEWDLPRGKHDGTFAQGKIEHRLFECAPLHGSFVRAHKLKKGVSLTQAIRERYAAEADESLRQERYVLARGSAVSHFAHLRQSEHALSGEDAVADLQSNDGCFKVQVEFVGEEETRQMQAQLSRLSFVSIPPESGVSSVCAESLSETCGNLKHVSLRDSLLSDWKHVHALVECGVVEVDVSDSFMRFDTLDAVLKAPTLDKWKKVKSLSLVRVPDACRVVHELWTCGALQGLKELSLSASDVVDDDFVSLFANADLPCLEIFDIAECKNLHLFASLTSTVGQLPKLKWIRADGSGLEDLGNAQLASDTMVSLERLWLKGTQIGDVADIEALAQLQSLTDLRCSATPFFEKLKQEGGLTYARGEVLARLKSVNVLNKSVVTERERSDAERLYLQRCLLHQHPEQCFRFDELCSIHGRPQQQETTSQRSGLLRVATVSFVCLDEHSDAFGTERAVLKKKVPLRMTLHQLQVVLKKLFGTRPSQQYITLKQPGSGSLPQVLNPAQDSERQLTYFGVTNDTEILLQHQD